MTHIKVLPST